MWLTHTLTLSAVNFGWNYSILLWHFQWKYSLSLFDCLRYLWTCRSSRATFPLSSVQGEDALWPHGSWIFDLGPCFCCSFSLRNPISVSPIFSVPLPSYLSGHPPEYWGLQQQGSECRQWKRAEDFQGCLSGRFCLPWCGWRLWNSKGRGL